MQKIVPNLWLNDNAQEVATFYTTVFNNSKILRTDYYTDAGKEIHGHNAGDILTVEFSIEDITFVALNGGPQFTINPSISFSVQYDTAQEVGKAWEKLSEDGTVLMPLDTYPFSERYGWIQDKFGISWQLTKANEEIKQKITPSLLFTKEHYGKAEEALDFYVSVFPDSAPGIISHYGEGQQPNKPDAVNYGDATILGQKITAMDSALEHDFSFNEAISLMVTCETQEEIDTYWKLLSAVPEAEACGWLKDKLGVSWQIVPTAMNEMLKNGTKEQIERVTASFMKMKKFDINTLENAYSGE